MGIGPNYGLNKGFLATGSTAYAAGEVVVISATQQVARATTANVLTPLGICMEDLDTTRLATGKAIIGVALAGIVRVIAGGSVSVGDRVTNNTSARAVTRTRASAGAQPAATFGIALTSATNDGDHIDVLLTPGATF